MTNCKYNSMKNTYEKMMKKYEKRKNENKKEKEIKKQIKKEKETKKEIKKYKKGDKILHIKTNSVGYIEQVHNDDIIPYYTININGREIQTTYNKLIFFSN